MRKLSAEHALVADVLARRCRRRHSRRAGSGERRAGRMGWTAKRGPSITVSGTNRRGRVWTIAGVDAAGGDGGRCRRATQPGDVMEVEAL